MSHRCHMACWLQDARRRAASALQLACGQNSVWAPKRLRKGSQAAQAALWLSRQQLRGKRFDSARILDLAFCSERQGVVARITRRSQPTVKRHRMAVAGTVLHHQTGLLYELA